MTLHPDQKILEENYAHCSWPGLYYGVVEFLARGIDAKNIAEIGVAYGYHAENILKLQPTITYHGIDPYLAGYDPDDRFVGDVCKLFNETDPQRAMDRLHFAVKHKLDAHGARARLIRDKSTSAVHSFTDGYLDVIFIDGDHTYAGARDDLAAWWPKLKHGGVFCGDDYRLPEVKKAVDEFAIGRNLALNLISKPGTSYPIWFIRNEPNGNPTESRK